MVRHGNTDWNNQHRIQGWTDVDLNENGIMQAYRASDMIKEYSSFDIVIASDLLRAHHTAKIISERLSIPFETDADIRERKHGILEGKTDTEVREKYPSLNMFSVVEGRETMKDFTRRIERFFYKISSEYDGKSIVVVTHGGVLKVLYSYYINEKYEYWRNGEVRLFEFENAIMRKVADER